MNLYDFDETIYIGDSTRDFCIYLYLRHPRTWLSLPKQLSAVVGYMTGKLNKTAFKERFFSMFKAVPNIHEEVEQFWDKNDHKVHRYYPGQARRDDVVISASPYFIVAPMCHRLGITNVIASNVDPETGHFTGENCYGEEKVRRFMAAGYDPEEVEYVYSDSMSDTPMADLGKQAFVVTKKGLTGWVPPKQTGMQAFFTLFNSRDALATLVLGLANIFTAGHAAKVLVRDKNLPVVGTHCGVLALNSASIAAVMALLGKRCKRCKRVARATAILTVPLLLTTGLITYGVATVSGMGILALALGTIGAVPVLYQGVKILFKKEILKQQALQEVSVEAYE